MRPVFPSSTSINDNSNNDKRKKYPWSLLNVGESFAVTPDEAKDVKFMSLCSHASRAGKKLGKKFKVIDHGADKGYEVACVGIAEAKQSEGLKGIF